MRRQLLLILFPLMILPAVVHASCFDFARKIDQPLPGQIPPGTASNVTGSGENHGLIWAKAEGRVDHSLHDVLANLLAHQATKSGAASQMRIHLVAQSPGWVHQKVDYVAKPFLFVTVKWTEDWGFSTLGGGPSNPDDVLITYEKTSGTKYINHLCGDIRLKKAGQNKTDVSIYEEVKAAHRNEEDTLKGIKSTISSLQNKIR